MAEHHDDFVHVPHDNLEEFAAKSKLSQANTNMDNPISPAHNAHGSNPEGAAGAPTAAADSGSVPSWLLDKDQGAASSRGNTQSNYQFGGVERGRDMPIPVVDLTDSSEQQNQQQQNQQNQQQQQQDAPRQSFIREVPRSPREESWQAAPTSSSHTPASSAESHTTPPPSKINEPSRTEAIHKKKTENCPLPIPNLLDFMQKHAPPKVQYVLFYKDPVYSLLVLGGVAGFLYLLMNGYTYNLLWLASFLLKWTMLTAFAVSGGHYAYKRFVQKNPNPIHYGERHFKPRIEPIVARFAPYFPPQDWLVEKVGCAVRMAYGAPRKFLNTIYSNNWGAMFRGLVALQIIQSLFCCLSPRGLVWLIFGLVCTVPKIYQMFHVPIDNFIHFVHSKITAVCHALSHTGHAAKPVVKHAEEPAKSPFPTTVTTTILTVPAGTVLPGLTTAAKDPVEKKEQ